MKCHDSMLSASGNAAVIVAHPDDETLWCAGTMLLHPEVQWTVIAMCRSKDPDRAPKFTRAMELLNATGVMGDLNDEPAQPALPEETVETTLLTLLPTSAYDLIITHSPFGEYTRHRRHEETSRAVRTLWEKGSITLKSLWMFAYEDGNGRYLPRPVKRAHRKEVLTRYLWQQKYEILTRVYGFSAESFEARTTPRAEAFWIFQSTFQLKCWLEKGVRLR
jgi:LmbE family N-acetylglucosaminyl deacetylase